MENYIIPKINKNEHCVTVESNYVFSYHTHMHSYCEMTLYESFDGTVTVNNNAFNIDSTTAILVIPSDFHRIEVSNGQKAKYIKIAFDTQLLCSEKALNSSIVLCNIGKDDFVFKLFYEILSSSDRPMYQRNLVHTAVLSLTEKGEKINSVGNSSGGCRYSKMAAGIINERFYEDITLCSVAAELCVSPQYLSVVFKDNIGINFSKYLSDIRLHRACDLLIETQKSISDICDICGYRNLSHFLRCFKNMFGCSPSLYRKKNSTSPIKKLLR